MEGLSRQVATHQFRPEDQVQAQVMQSLSETEETEETGERRWLAVWSVATSQWISQAAKADVIQNRAQISPLGIVHI